MQHDTRFRVRPTFPLDARRIRQRKWVQMIKSPVTILGILGAVIGTVALRGSLPGLVGIWGAATAGLTTFWRRRDEQLESSAVQAMVRESNQQQDRELLRIISSLRQQGHHQYAISLGKFLLLKQHIETELHRDGGPSRKKQEIENLVDSLCSAICDEITTAKELDERVASVLTSSKREQLEQLVADRKACYDRIMRAYDTLYQANSRLNVILRPGHETDQQQPSQVLDRLIDQLREETHVAERIHEQLSDRALRRDRLS